MPRLILVTGANGFLGTIISASLEREGYAVRRGARETPHGMPGHGHWIAYGHIGPHTAWRSALEDIDAVVHLAGIAHGPAYPSPDIAHLLDEVNVAGTEKLALAAAECSVRRLVLVSTALVHGSRSSGLPISERSRLCPSGPYARSKLRSEECLRNAAAETGMEIVILRPPMVYGPGVKGNFSGLVRFVRSGLPLPLGAATAPRSFIGAANLAHAVAVCLQHPLAAGEAFLVRDQETSSTADLIQRVAVSLGRRATNVPVWPPLVAAGLRAAGRGQDFDRLFAPFEIDARHIEERLGWRAPVSLADGIRQALGQQTGLPDFR